MRSSAFYYDDGAGHAIKGPMVAPAPSPKPNRDLVMKTTRITMVSDTWDPILLPEENPIPGVGDQYDVPTDVLERFRAANTEFWLAFEELHQKARRVTKQHHKPRMR